MQRTSRCPSSIGKPIFCKYRTQYKYRWTSVANRHLQFLLVSSWSLPVCATNSVKFGWISPKMPVYGWKCCFLGLLSEKPCFGLKDDTLQPLKVGLPGNHRAGWAQCATSWTPSPFLSKLLCNLLPFAATQPPCFLVDLLCCFAKHIDSGPPKA